MTPRTRIWALGFLAATLYAARQSVNMDSATTAVMPSNYTLAPPTSLQCYAQPFVSRGFYRDVQYQPGSTQLLIWNQGRNGFYNVNRTSIVSADFRGVFSLHRANTPLVKASFWLNR